jgi:hypothetical protein
MNIVAGAWHEKTEDLIGRALATATLDDIKKQVSEGAQLFEVQHLGETVVAFVLRIDRLTTKNEGVIVVAAGELPGVDLTSSIVPTIEKMFIGCHSIRMHTDRIGLAKKMERLGYVASEIVLRKGL